MNHSHKFGSADLSQHRSWNSACAVHAFGQRLFLSVQLALHSRSRRCPPALRSSLAKHPDVPRPASPPASASGAHSDTGPWPDTWRCVLPRPCSPWSIPPPAEPPQFTRRRACPKPTRPRANAPASAPTCRSRVRAPRYSSLRRQQPRDRLVFECLSVTCRVLDPNRAERVILAGRQLVLRGALPCDSV